MCERFLKGEYQYFLAVHNDRDHIHLHVIFNNVNQWNGRTFETNENRRYTQKDRSYNKLRDISDKVCKEHNLSVIIRPEEKTETDFFTCTAWNRNADVVVDWFGKGDIITLVGAVHINQYEKNGEKRNSTDVKVEEIHFSGGKKNNNSNTNAGSGEEPLF